MPLFRDGHCPPLTRWSEPNQIAAFTSCALLVNVSIGYILSSFGATIETNVRNLFFPNFGIVIAFLYAVIAPFYETLIGQWLPLLVGRILKRPPFTRILWASAWFGLLHLPQGFTITLQTFGVGWVLASCFMFCYQDSWMKAYRVTSLAHSAHNCIVFFIAMGLEKLS